MNGLTIAFLALSGCALVSGQCGFQDYGCDGYSGYGQFSAGLNCPLEVGPIYSSPSAYQIPYGATQICNRPSYLELSNDAGPQPRLEPIKYLPTYSLPVQQLPLKVIEAGPLPAPVVIANKCVCTKVVQKPQLYQRLIVQQKNQRFLKKTYVPRTEKVAYCAKPRC